MNNFINDLARFMGKSRLKRAWVFGLLLFSPVYLLLLLPLLVLLPNSISTALIAIIDPSFSFADVFASTLWVIGPILSVVCLFVLGMWLHAAIRRGLSPRLFWITTWVLLSAGLFMAFWLVVSVIGSVGASDMESQVFFRTTATVAAVMTLCLQVLIVPWILVFSRAMFNDKQQLESFSQ